MISLILTIFCSTSIALILKLNDSNKGNPIILLNGNYLAASVISLILILINSQFVFSWQSLLFGAFLAVFFVSSFFSFAKAVSVAGPALATVSSRLSVIIPVFLSIFIFNEIPGTFQYFGIALALLTIYLFYLSLKNIKHKKLTRLDYFYLFAVLIGIGIADFCIKIFQTWRPPAEKEFFLFSIFFFSFLLTGVIILFRKIPFERKTAFGGMILGIPNIFSTFFLIGALSALPAIIVYPTVNIGIILLTSLSAALIWKEKLNGYAKLALIVGSVAILFLSL
ncbi:MAG: EamA family transporter [Melioribacteraceae bacterium]|nr:EamA family transporter [Melioribacteraceae bacterium]